MKPIRFFLLLSTIIVVLINLAACSSTPQRESTGEFFDSSLITAKIKARLIDDRITGGFQIKVMTYRGIVYLSGEVNSEQEKNHATVIANGVDGVKGIENELVIRATN